jgi:hypothetical protein
VELEIGYRTVAGSGRKRNEDALAVWCPAPGDEETRWGTILGVADGTDRTHHDPVTQAEQQKSGDVEKGGRRPHSFLHSVRVRDGEGAAVGVVVAEELVVVRPAGMIMVAT